MGDKYSPQVFLDTVKRGLAKGTPKEKIAKELVKRGMMLNEMSATVVVQRIAERMDQEQGYDVQSSPGAEFADVAQGIKGVPWQYFEHPEFIEYRVKDVPRPNAALMDALQRIGFVKNVAPGSATSELEAIAIRGCFNVLGLFVQMPHGKVSPSISKLPAARKGWLLQAGEETVSHLDAWKLNGETDWHVVNFRPGTWEELVQPTLELAVFLNHYFKQPGPLKDKINAIETVGAHFKRTGELNLPRPEPLDKILPSSASEEPEAALEEPDRGQTTSARERLKRWIGF